MILNYQTILPFMSSTKIQKYPKSLEQMLGFKMDCPRCRAWELYFKSCNQAINVKCKQCGLELMINTESLVKYTGNNLSLNF